MVRTANRVYLLLPSPPAQALGKGGAGRGSSSVRTCSLVWVQEGLKGGSGSRKLDVLVAGWGATGAVATVSHQLIIPRTLTLSPRSRGCLEQQVAVWNPGRAFSCCSRQGRQMSPEPRSGPSWLAVASLLLLLLLAPPLQPQLAPVRLPLLPSSGPQADLGQPRPSPPSLASSSPGAAPQCPVPTKRDLDLSQSNVIFLLILALGLPATGCPCRESQNEFLLF